MTLRDDIWMILRTPDSYEWEVQGFGMLRTYLPGENEPRLQIWDQRLAVWEFSPIHDHPWDFTSTIVAGHLFNQRYLRCNAASLGAVQAATGSAVEEYNEAVIVPGPANQGTESVGKCWLAPKPLEVYGPGERYSQTWDELHQTKFAQGTITVIERSRTRPDGDLASSIWKGAGPWVSARPRKADPIEARTVVRDALSTWFV